MTYETLAILKEKRSQYLQQYMNTPEGEYKHKCKILLEHYQQLVEITERKLTKGKV